MEMDGQFEIVIYRLKPDQDRDQFMEISAWATEWLRQRPGYLGRQLLEDDNGFWVDLVRWATMDDALAAASAFIEVPEAAAFMDAVEPESVSNASSWITTRSNPPERARREVKGTEGWARRQ